MYYITSTIVVAFEINIYLSIYLTLETRWSIRYMKSA